MPTIESHVDFINRFPVISQEVNDLAVKAVREAAKVGAARAQQVASQRSDTGAMSNMRVSSPTGSVDGWEAAFVSPVFYSWFQNYGTLAQRSKPLKNPGRRKLAAPKGSGIRPMYFLNMGRRAGRDRMLEVIRQGLPK